MRLLHLTVMETTPSHPMSSLVCLVSRFRAVYTLIEHNYIYYKCVLFIYQLLTLKKYTHDTAVTPHTVN